MNAIIAFFSGGKMAIVVAVVLAAVGGLWRLLSNTKKAGVDQEAARNAAAREKAREQELDRIKAAASAAASAKRMPDDPNDRDNDKPA